MTYLLAGIVVVAAIAAPYLVAWALSAAFPRLHRWSNQMPRTDEVVARFFDRTIPSVSRTDDGGGSVSERRRLGGTQWG
jgi:hypothetical protein